MAHLRSSQPTFMKDMIKILFRPTYVLRISKVTSMISLKTPFLLISQRMNLKKKPTMELMQLIHITHPMINLVKIQIPFHFNKIPKSLSRTFYQRSSNHKSLDYSLLKALRFKRKEIKSLTIN